LKNSSKVDNSRLRDTEIKPLIAFKNIVCDRTHNRAAMKAGVLNASLGHIRIKTMPAVSREEWKTVLKETWGKSKKKK